MDVQANGRLSQWFMCLCGSSSHSYRLSVCQSMHPMSHAAHDEEHLPHDHRSGDDSQRMKSTARITSVTRCHGMH